MNYFSFRDYISIFFSIVTTIIISFGLCEAKVEKNTIPKIELTEKDIQDLGLNTKEAKEFQELVDWVNNLSDEDKQFFAKLGEEIEKDMTEKKLDPRNPDDILKWIDQAVNEPAVKEKEKKEEKKEKPELQEIKPVDCPVPQPNIIPVASPKNTKTMFDKTIKHIENLREKASTDEYMSFKLIQWQQELHDFLYFLHILMNEDLIKYLVSLEFTELYQNLECFYKEIATYEPLVKAKETVEYESENPYAVLRISSMATPQEIENAYKKLKKTYSPEKIQKKLKELGISEKEIKRRIKEAQLTFKFIQQAYDTLKDQKQKAIIDRIIKEKVSQEKQERILSDSAFNKILDTFSSKIYPILTDINKLLEKYKPEELAKAKKQEELEKKKLAETKERIKITTPERLSRFDFRFKPENDYEQFWQHLSQIEQQKAYRGYRSYVPSFYFNNGFTIPSSKHESEQKIKEEKSIGKKDDKKEAKKDDKRDDKGAPGKRVTKSKDKKEDKKEDKSDKDFERGMLINIISKLLEQTKDEFETELPSPSATTKKLKIEDDKEIDISELEPKEETVKIELEKLSNDLNEYLKSRPTKISKSPTKKTIKALTKEQTIPKYLMAFAQENKFHDLWENLIKLNPGPDTKIDNPTLSKMWKEKVYDKYSKRIQSWYEQLYTILNEDSRIPLKKGPLNPDKKVFHGLVEDEKTIKDPKKVIKDVPEELADKFPNLEKVNLGVIKKYVKEIFDSFNNTSKAFGIK